jgi:hypothetical protein
MDCSPFFVSIALAFMPIVFIQIPDVMITEDQSVFSIEAVSDPLSSLPGVRGGVIPVVPVVAKVKDCVGLLVVNDPLVGFNAIVKVGEDEGAGVCHSLYPIAASMALRAVSNRPRPGRSSNFQYS